MSIPYPSTAEQDAQIEKSVRKIVLTSPDILAELWSISIPEAIEIIRHKKWEYLNGR